MNKPLYALAAIIAIIIGLGAYQMWPQEQPKALVYEPPRALEPFQLEYTKNQGTATNESLQGQWTLLFTGYTFCPDICPTTLADLKGILPALNDTADAPVKVWMISVDPQRDDLERLTEYTGFFGDNIEGVRAAHPELFPFVRGLGLMYSVPEEGQENYLVNHSAAIILVNPEGKRLAIFNADHTAGEIPTVDMQQLQRDFSILAD